MNAFGIGNALDKGLRRIYDMPMLSKVYASHQSRLSAKIIQSRKSCYKQ